MKYYEEKHRTLHEAIYNYEILIYKIQLNIHSRTHSAKRSRIQKHVIFDAWMNRLIFRDKNKVVGVGFQPLEKYESQLGPFTAQKNKETSTKKKAWCRETFRTFIPKILSNFSQNLTVRSMIYSWRGCKPAKGGSMQNIKLRCLAVIYTQKWCLKIKSLDPAWPRADFKPRFAGPNCAQECGFVQPGYPCFVAIQTEVELGSWTRGIGFHQHVRTNPYIILLNISS